MCIAIFRQLFATKTLMFHLVDTVEVFSDFNLFLMLFAGINKI